MAWTTGNAVSIGDPTKKSHYDKIWDNADWIYANMAVRAWLQFDGTVGSSDMIQGSFGVGSITDNGVGDYNINWDSDFDNNNYCVVTACKGADTVCSINAPSTATIQIYTLDVSVPGLTNTDIVCILAIGDQ